jgi:hypothetical protein
MTWSSRPDLIMSSSLISRRHSTACDSFDGSLTRRSASLVCHKENYSDSLLVTEQIEGNMEKINAITTMDAPRIIKDV